MPTKPEPDILYMQRALQLASMGAGAVAPNPMVGCLIVYNQNIIGEGWHQQYGHPHAERNAVDSVTDKSLIAQSAIYVTLEPCTHWGNTPPCTNLLLKHQPQRVVICNTDSNPTAAGGIAKLKAAGIAVESGVLAQEGRWLNRRFFTSVEKKRPYILLKWAQTADGYMARKDYSSKWISNTLSRKMVHKWRGEEAAVLVGRQTALHDNPQLTIRDWPLPAFRQQQPLRIVLDRQAQLPDSLHLFTDGTPSLVFSNFERQYANANVQHIVLDNTNMLPAILESLHAQKIQSVMVEGGPALLKMLLEQGLWDEARIITAPHSFVEGLPAPRPTGYLASTELLQDNRLEVWLKEKEFAPA